MSYRSLYRHHPRLSLHRRLRLDLLLYPLTPSPQPPSTAYTPSPLSHCIMGTPPQMTLGAALTLPCRPSLKASKMILSTWLTLLWTLKACCLVYLPKSPTFRSRTTRSRRTSLSFSLGWPKV